MKPTAAAKAITDVLRDGDVLVNERFGERAHLNQTVTCIAMRRVYSEAYQQRAQQPNQEGGSGCAARSHPQRVNDAPSLYRSGGTFRGSSVQDGKQQHQQGIRDTGHLGENSRRHSSNQERSREAGTDTSIEDDRDQIVRALAEKLATEPKQVQTFFDALAELATEQTREAGEFKVPGLGKLVKAERKERMGRNPATGEEMKIAAKTTVKFRIVEAAAEAIALPKA